MLLSWSTLVCGNFKRSNVAIWFFLVCYNQSKVHLQSTLDIAVSKCKVPGFWLFCFDLSTFTKMLCIKDIFHWGVIFADFSSALVTQILYVKFLHSGNFFCSVKKETMLLCTLHFQGIVCPKPCFLILIYHHPNSMSKTDSFKTFFICDAPYTYFESIRFSESCLLILLWHSLNCLKLIYKFKLLSKYK